MARRFPRRHAPPARGRGARRFGAHAPCGSPRVPPP
ncbi:hypothetical protein M218_10180 [Burkholderia pseudomallei MSHR338]|nr:hypothetical protein M218_10180 [Burkholderia pseudomallei MSHR338]